MSALLFAGLVGGSLLLLLSVTVLLALLLHGSRRQLHLERRAAATASDSDEFAGVEQRPLLHGMARGGRAIEGWVDAEGESARLLLQAGWRSTEARVLWYAFQAAIPLCGAVALLTFWLFGPEKDRALMLMLYGFMVLALSVLLPRWVLRGVAGARRERLKAEVPLFIHLLVLLFEAGLSTRQALASLVREGGGVLPELGREFELVLRSLDAGADTAEVLKSMSEALQVDDLTNALSVLRQVDRYGGELREPLLDTLKVLEERRGLDLREQVNLMSGRMTVVMVLFFFPALLIFIAGPAFMSIIKALNDVGK